MNPVKVRRDEILFDGQSVQILEYISGKFIAHLSRGRIDYCERWIAHCQELGFNSLRVFGEEMQPKPGYEHPPHYRPWPLNQMLNGVRVKENQVDRWMLEALYSISQKTGMAFSLVIDNTLKDIDGLAEMEDNKGAGMIGHVISRTLDVCRQVAEQYPGGKVIFDFHYGWDTGVVKFKDSKAGLNQQAKRVRRWVKGTYPNHSVEYSYTSPGSEWRPEQYPDAVISVSQSGGEFSYEVGTSHMYDYPIIAIQAPGGMEPFPLGPAATTRAPIFVTKSEFATDDNHDQYVRFFEWALDAGLHLCVCDQKGASTDLQMPKTKLEEYLVGEDPPPPPPPPPDDWGTIYQWKAESKEFRFQSRRTDE